MAWHDVPRIVTPPPSSHLGLVLHPIIILGPVHEAQDEECDEEEYAVHDAERETRLLHRAVFFDGGRETVRSRDPIASYRQICRAAGTDAGTVGAGDAAEFVHARDEGADEAEVDKGNEEGGSLS